MEEVSGFVDEIGDRLKEIANSDLVVGEAIRLGEVTIVPLSQVGIGFGGGGGGGRDTKSKKGPGGQGSGGGSGGGGGVTPIAVAVFRSGSVEILKVPSKPSPMGRFLERIPDLIDRIKD